MNTLEIKKLVSKFRQEYGIRNVTVESLEEIFRTQGFTIIDFNPVVNDPDVTTVIKSLRLHDRISHSSGFVYVDGNYRLLFLNEKLNKEERLVVLAHEEGHYYCGHTCSRNEVGRTVIEEQEANEFSHYLLHGTVRSRVSNIASKYKKPLIIGGVIAGLAAGGGAALKEIHDRQIYEGEYYVTEHGEKYHLKNCITIQEHETRRLTKEDVESGTYEPCSVCLSNQYDNQCDKK